MTILGLMSREEYVRAMGSEWAAIGAAFKEKRNQYGLSAQEVALSIGISASTLRRFEKGLPVRSSQIIVKAYSLLFTAVNAKRKGYDDIIEEMDIDRIGARIFLDCDFEANMAFILSRADGTEIAKIDTGVFETNRILAEEMCKSIGEPYTYSC